MSTGKDPHEEAPPPGTPGGPGPFSEEELAAVSAPAPDELDEVEPAAIEEVGPEPEPEASFERLVQRSRKLSPERVRTVVESLLFVADRPLSIEQLFESTGLRLSLRQRLRAQQRG